MRTTIALTFLTLASLTVVRSSEASEPDPRPPLSQERNHPPALEAAAFGKQGQWVLQPATSFGFSRNSADNDVSVSESQRTTGTFSLDRFFTDRLTLGLVASYQRERWDSSWIASPPGATSPDGSSGEIHRSEGRSWTGFLGLAAGWNRPLGTWASFWPRAQVLLGYGRSSFSQQNGQITSAPGDQKHWSLGLETTAAVLIHPTRHFFIGAGPRLDVRVMRVGQMDQRLVDVYVSPTFILGGWL
jgi:hypothetical protein